MYYKCTLLLRQWCRCF